MQRILQDCSALIDFSTCWDPWLKGIMDIENAITMAVFSKWFDVSNPEGNDEVDLCEKIPLMLNTVFCLPAFSISTGQ